MISANLFAQFISFVVAPLYAYIYTTEQFGEFALFLIYVNFFASFLSLRLEWSVPNAESYSDARLLIKYSFIISLIVSIAISVLIFFSFLDYLKYLFSFKVPIYDFLIGVSAFVVTLKAVLISAYVRKNKLIKVSNTIFVSVSLNVFLILIFGYFKIFENGLIMAFAITNTLVLFVFGKDLIIYFSIKKRNFKKILKYKNQIQSSVTTSILNFIFQNSIPVILALKFSITEMGIYYLANRIVHTPSSLISESFANAFWGEISKLTKTNIYLARVFYLKWTLRLLGLGSLICIIIYLVSSQIYTFFDEEKWVNLDKIFIVLIPGVFGTIVFSSTNHFIVYNKQHYQLVADILYIFLILIMLWLSYKYNLDMITTVFLMSISILITYTFSFFLNLYANYKYKKEKI